MSLLDSDSGGAVAYECKCCSGRAMERTFFAREMMYGTGAEFEYAVCSQCRSLQLRQVPGDMSIYYQKGDYASWRKIPTHIKRRPSLLRRLLLGKRTDHAMCRPNAVGAWLTRRFGEPEFPYDWEWFRYFGIKRSDRILDFGCGTGNLLYYLRSNGFTQLVGVDKFSTGDPDNHGLQVLPTLPVGLERTFDLVMAHHSIEHVESPYDEMQRLKRFARPGAGLLIRLPVAHSFAADEYGEHWVQLDPPRHMVLPSEAGMRSLGDRLGLQLLRVEYDSTEFQFIGSEQYRAGIAMFDGERSWLRNKKSPYDAPKRAALEARATALNVAGQGDQAAYYFRVPMSDQAATPMAR